MLILFVMSSCIVNSFFSRRSAESTFRRCGGLASFLRCVQVCIISVFFFSVLISKVVHFYMLFIIHARFRGREVRFGHVNRKRVSCSWLGCPRV